MKIYHLSDIHIRLYKRHKEYEAVFQRVYDYIQSTKQPDDIIFLGGDIVHNKTDMSPEMIAVTTRFLRTCADICPTILIPGNHDGNCSNLQRLDALTPIVEALNHPNLYFWKDSGVYELNGISFSVFGIFDSIENWIPANKINAEYKIALHHGTITGAMTDIGHEIETGITLEHFNGFELGLCGDVHLCQFLNRERTIAYSSSLIGQSYGESVDEHGLIVWDLETKQGTFVPIQNDYGFVTFNLISGKCIIPDNLPKNLRVRIQHDNSTPEEIEAFVREIGKSYNIVELIKQRLNGTQIQNRAKYETLGHSRNIDFQNKIISEFLTAMELGTKSEIDAVCKLNSETNKLLPVNSSQRNVIWKPIKLEFSNMFSYGEDNVVDFSKLNESYGIWAKNATGKSSFLSILTFALFDKTPVASKASHILNNTKDSFQCKIQFELNGRDYFIERVGTKKKDGAVKVDVTFWTINEFGDIVNLNGEDRDRTNYQIRNYVGTYDDFVLTALSTQYDNQNFIDKTQRDRKELLYKFLDITVYDDLYKIAKEESKECQVLIKEFERENLQSKLSVYNTQIQDQQYQLDDIERQIKTVKKEIKVKSDELVELNKIYHPTSNTLNLNQIDSEIASTQKQIEQCNLQFETNTRQIEKYNTEISEIAEKIKNEPDNFETVIEQLNKLKSTIDASGTKLKLLTRELIECKNQETLLHNHKYDPSCQYCIDNEFVKTAKNSISKIPDIERSIAKISSEIETSELQYADVKVQLAEAKKIRDLVNKRRQLFTDLNLLKEQQKTLEYKQKSNNAALDGYKISRDEYLKNAEIIERNTQILLEITKIRTEIDTLDKSEIGLLNNYRALHSTLDALKTKHEECNNKVDKYLQYVNRFRIYDLYLQSLSREGVPYRILETVLPVIESEVNQILNNLVDFTVRLEATDDKYIHGYIVYNASNSWPVELSSGMERFILSLAFRTSLSEITTLPKANFLAIDEGFGVLDSENLLSIANLFTYLKKQYEFLICVSHMDSMKDMVDNQIKIEKIKGYSRIVV